MKKFLLLFSLIITSLTYGQASKKVVLTYSPGYSFLPYGFTVSNKLLGHHHLGARVNLAKSISIGAHFKYTKKEFDFRSFEEMTFKDVLFGGDVRYYFGTKYNGMEASNGYYLGIGYSEGKQNSLRHFVDSTDYLINSAYSVNKKSYDDMTRVRMRLLTISIGRDYVLWKHFYCGYGLEFGINLDEQQGVRKKRHLYKGNVSIGLAF